MKQVQFQTDSQYLCFNHAVKLALHHDEELIWGETVKRTPHCIRCVEAEIAKGIAQNNMLGGTATFLRERARKL